MLIAEIFSFLIAIHVVLWLFGVVLRRWGDLSVTETDDRAIVRLALVLFWGGVAVFSGPPWPLLIAELLILWYTGTFMIAWGIKGSRMSINGYHGALYDLATAVMAMIGIGPPKADYRPESGE